MVIAEQPALGSVLDGLVKTVERSLPRLRGSIVLVENGVLRPGASPSLPESYASSVDGLAVDGLDTIVPVGLRTAQATPLLSREGALIGTFTLYHREDESLRIDHAIVELVARTAALVIERDREARERRAAEEALSKQVSALTRIHSLASKLAQITELREKLVEILAAAAELQETNCGLLSVQNPATGALEVVASLNFPREALDIVREITPSPTATACSSAFTHSERTIVEDTESDPRFVGYRRIARNVGFRAVCSTPIYNRQGTLLGVISLHSPRPGRPTALQVQLADMCAMHAADAIEGARAHERLADLAGNMSQHAWIADERGAITWFNQRWFDYTGTTNDDVIGWGWTRVHHPDHVKRVVAKWQKAWGSGDAWEDTFPLRGIDGTYRWFLAHARPIRDTRGHVVRWFGTHTDITEQREIQTALETASQAKDHFLAALSHELRTPLSPILMAATALEKAPELPPGLKPKLAMIRRNVELETKLIDDLLDLAKIKAGKLSLSIEVCSVAEVVDDVLDICRAQIDQKHLRLTFSHDGECMVKADPARLSQIMWNLVKNAAKFTPNGGEIAIRAEADETTSRVIVSDSGIGIAPDALGRVFEAFEQADASITRQFGGLGLGLAISRRLAELHGGTLTAASGGRDRGATFTFELPRHRGRRAVTAKPIALPSTEPVELLVVDDHADTAEILSTLLAAQGFVVRIATSATEAMSLCATLKFDLVISDVGLPDRTGYDLMSEIRTKFPDLPGIAMSGWGRDEDRKVGLAAGFSEHLTKPIALNDLVAAIHRTLGLKAEETSGSR